MPARLAAVCEKAVAFVPWFAPLVRGLLYVYHRVIECPGTGSAQGSAVSIPCEEGGRPCVKSGLYEDWIGSTAAMADADADADAPAGIPYTRVAASCMDEPVECPDATPPITPEIELSSNKDELPVSPPRPAVTFADEVGGTLVEITYYQVAEGNRLRPTSEKRRSVRRKRVAFADEVDEELVEVGVHEVEEGNSFRPVAECEVEVGKGRHLGSFVVVEVEEEEEDFGVLCGDHAAL